LGDRLKNKVAIVTGAGSIGPGWGNGKATAVLFAREGAKVLAIDINLAAVEETKALIAKEGGDCTICRADVSKSAAVQDMVEQCLKTYGRIDILQNNVGITVVGGPVEISEETWEQVQAVNLKSMFLTCKYVLPHMERQGGGAIVNMSSIAGIRYLGVPYLTYSTTKAAILQLTQSIALQYAEKNIRANCILPGLLATPMIIEFSKKARPDDWEKLMEIRRQQVPMKKMGDAWDVAHASVFLASDEAKYITGAQIVIDGGLSCKCL
jgi:NAD(P)-dependent dehydrogenase (short-subunit alcohol dehydrogenase family)